MKNQTMMITSIIIALAVGLILGWLIWGNKNCCQGMNMHQMPDGSMMGGSGKMNMNDMMKSMNVGLEGKTGDTFDKEFLSEMIVHHEGAVAMAEQVLEKSKRPELIKLANDIISAQTSEISMMKGWQTEWFK